MVMRSAIIWFWRSLASAMAAGAMQPKSTRVSRWPHASVTDVSRNFADYINRVAYRGERFVLIRGGEPVAELSPVPTGTRLGDLPALLSSLPRLGEDEADALADDLDRARTELTEHPPEDRWGS